MFDAVAALETQDAAVERKRRTASTQTRDLKRSMAAQSQTGIYSSLVECRILLQRAMVASAAAAAEQPSRSSVRHHMRTMTI